MYSLTRNPQLWCSTEDSVELSRQRIAFLSQFPESEFRTQLERVSRPLAKNEKLAEMCLQKLKTEKDLNRQIGLLNQAMTMTDNAEACGRYFCASSLSEIT